jgi:hypothetical protein
VTRIILTGGLGNQLFKALGAIRVLNNQFNAAIFDISWYQESNFSEGYTAPRSFELHNFPNFRNIPSVVKSHAFSSYESRLIARYPRIMSLFGYFSTSVSQSFINTSPGVIKGDFESVTALPPDSLISELLKFSDTRSSWLADMTKLSERERPIAVHVRRSDYLNYSNTYPKLGLSYYLPALGHLSTVLGKRPVWLFSDDPVLVLSEFRGQVDFDRIIDSDAAVHSVELLELMSTCLGIVTANSTFSWWAAYIGELNGNVKSVVLPEIFTLLENDPGKCLRVPGWKIIPIIKEETQ